MNLNHATNKQSGDQLLHTEWNALAADVNELGAGGVGGGSSVVTVTEDSNSTDPTVNVAVVSGVQTIASPNVIQLTKKKKGVNTTLVSGNNINIEPRESVGETKGGNIAFKPGDDIEFCSHHRLAANQNEVSMKIIDGDDLPVKLQLNAASMTLTTKDKTGDDANVFDINVNSGKNTKGYLKVRAQAIDLRCEDHGGVALQPKGEDSDHNENKIKFEHGGGDGLEFGTFNTKHTSLFTEDYRFNKDGIIRLATRQTVVSDKADVNDPTTSYKYVKNSNDDFYDFFENSNTTCTWADIVSYISWMKNEQIGIFAAKAIMDNKLSTSPAGNPQIKVLCGAHKSVSAQVVANRASNISTTIGGVDYELTPIIENNGLKLVTQYQGGQVVVFMLSGSGTSSTDLPDGTKACWFNLSYDPASSLDASGATLTIGNFDFVGLF